MQLVSRSISIRCVIEHWSSATNFDSFHHQLKDFIANNKECPEFKQICEDSFRITVESFNKTIQQKTKIDKIETLYYLPFDGEVNLRNPKSEFFYIEYFVRDPINVPIEPDEIFFGKWVSSKTIRFTKKIKLNNNK